MHPTQALINTLLDKYPGLTLATAGQIVRQIEDPSAVLFGLGHLVVTRYEPGSASDEDNAILAAETSRQCAEVRVVVAKGAARVLMGPIWYADHPDDDTWDGHCTGEEGCAWETSGYFDDESSKTYIRFAREHLENDH